MKDGGNESKKRITPTRQGLYAKAAVHAEDAIKVLVREMENGDNSNSRVGAAKALLSKTIPDLKAIEMKDENGKTVPFILNEYIITKDEFRRLLETRSVPGNTDVSVAGPTARME